MKYAGYAAKLLKKWLKDAALFFFMTQVFFFYLNQLTPSP